ncbi:MAG TPA: hypothetical protein VMZ29_10835 [Candidatus Bathyarchaeia archaeon]|nr:hypothetical protein [Candidatus Bathyarchaeia archaeon]
MKRSKILIVLASIIMVGSFLVPMQTHAKPAQKLDFFVQDLMTYEAQNDVVVTGNVIHVNDYQCTHIILVGYIGESPINGYLDSYFKVNHNTLTNKMTVNGISIFYITWNDYVGGFSGVKAMKIDMNADIDAGEYLLTGIFNMHGFGDFEGMELNGIVYGYVQINFFEGTVLIPN